MLIDLHTHSNCSDGTDSPAELIRHARDASLDVLALTDHDTSDGWDEARRAAAAQELQLVPGMEISCLHARAGVHLLAYYLDPDYPPLAAELDKIRAGRINRLPAMLAGLREAGIAITQADVDGVSTEASSPGRPHVADALVKLGVVRNREEAFDRYLGWGRPGYVSHYATELAEMLTLVRQAGGVSVVAHPWGRGSRRVLTAGVLADLAAIGLTGIEVDHLDHDAAARAQLTEIGSELGLVATGGSDYHGTGKLDHPLGGETTDLEQFERLQAAVP
ncbi:PHP domain-containing protein [Aeromicrobium sp.]|uniref:PHP domain-containing protein n=1 Tax=Aeromicrobium sp. TaxID=1871063 RepID=UPI003D6BC05C